MSTQEQATGASFGPGSSPSVEPASEVIPENWKESGPAFNKWYDDAAGFLALIQRHDGFWCTDHTVKYLNIRVDTRDGGFVFLPDRHGIEMTAERVLKAIKEWNSPLWRGESPPPQGERPDTATPDEEQTP